MAALDLLINDRTIGLLIGLLDTWSLSIGPGVRTFVWRWIQVFIDT